MKMNDSFIKFIEASSCGPKNEHNQKRKVCCGTYDNYLDKVAPSSVTPSPFHGDSLPQKCGRPEIISNRIYGGTAALTNEFPWMVRLKHLSKYNFASYGCSGFLIHSHYVLTAGHCLNAETKETIGPVVEVELGTLIDTGGNYCVDGDGEVCKPLSVKVDITISHKDYDSVQHRNDIAVVRLHRNVDESRFIKPICLSSNSIDQKELWLTGWGRTETGATSSLQLKVSVPRVDMDVCAKKYQQLKMIVNDTQLCAGGVAGRDSCTGDSGGPLMAMSKDNIWYAEGIVSYGAGCGRKNWPGVYTKVSKYINWIIETMDYYK